MGALDVGLGEAGVVADHVQLFVSEDHLEGEDVASSTEVGYGEGMAQAVGVDVGDAGAVGDGG